MSDMTAVIVPKSDQINADDLIGGDMTITITGVKIQGGQEQPVSMTFDGSPKVFRPCKSMCRVLVAVWGPDANAYVGRSLRLYRDPSVKWGGMEVGGIRIRAMSHMQEPMTMALTATKGARKPYTVHPLRIDPPAPQMTPAEIEAIQTEARAEADKGTTSFRVWWSANPDKRAACKDILPALQATCKLADTPPEELDEFGLPRTSEPPCSGA